MRKKTRNQGRKPTDSKKALNRRALLQKIGAGIALTAAGSTLDLGLAQPKPKPKSKNSLKLEGDLLLLDLSQGSIKIAPGVTIECHDDHITVRCGASLPTPTPVP